MLPDCGVIQAIERLHAWVLEDPLKLKQDKRGQHQDSPTISDRVEEVLGWTSRLGIGADENCGVCGYPHP
jgi:hypothetical protein